MLGELSRSWVGKLGGVLERCVLTAGGLRGIIENRTIK